MPWPHSLTLLAGIAAATSTIRLAAAAVIVPLEAEQKARRTARAGKAAETKVQFFAMQTMRT